MNTLDYFDLTIFHSFEVCSVSQNLIFQILQLLRQVHLSLLICILRRLRFLKLQTPWLTFSFFNLVSESVHMSLACLIT